MAVRNYGLQRVIGMTSDKFVCKQSLKKKHRTFCNWQFIAQYIDRESAAAAMTKYKEGKFNCIIENEFVGEGISGYWDVYRYDR